MESLFTKGKIWIEKTIKCIKDKLVSAANILVCLQQCRHKFTNRPQRRRHNRQLRKSTLSTTDNSLKISFDDGPPLPGVLPLDDFRLSTPRAGDGSNSTTTEESASDDSLLGSPNVDQRNDRRLVQVELALTKASDSRWTKDRDNPVMQAIDECKSVIVDTSEQSITSISFTSRTCSACNSNDAGVADVPTCEQLRKMNQELLAQLREGNERILALEKQLLQFQGPETVQKSVLTTIKDFEMMSDQVSIAVSESTEIFAADTECRNSQSGPLPILTKSKVALSLPPRPPPPPPLPPPNWNLSTASTGSSKRRKSMPVSSCPLKTLNWIKLNEDSLAGTVWVELEDEGLYSLLDLKEIDKHFACASNYDPFGTIRSRLSVCSMIREISVLDARRAQNCAILLSKLKLSDCEIKDAVSSLDTGDCIPKDMAEQLLKFIPTKEEIALLSPYVNSKEVLHPADRFFIEISTIKRYEQRLQCLCFKKSFKETTEGTTKDIASITSASRRVLASKRLRKLLAAILAIGNYLNQSKRSSDAFGFHLSVLTVLQDMKSSLSNEYTLMHYLVESCHKSMPDLSGLLQETAVSMEAAKVSGADIQTDMDKLRDGLKLLAAEIKANETGNNGGGGTFAAVATPLLAEYKESYSTLENSFKEMKNAFATCCKAYAPEDHYAETLNVSEFFGYFSQFLNQFTTVETQIMRKRNEQEMRTLTLTRAKAKRQSTVTGATRPSCVSGYNQRTRRSGRVIKKAVTDVNEDLLTSVLLAMDDRRGRNAGVSDVFLCGPRQRRSFRLSTKRRQLKTSNSSSSGQTVIRRRTSTQANPPLGQHDATIVELTVEDHDLDRHETDKAIDNARKRRRSKHSDNLRRER